MDEKFTVKAFVLTNGMADDHDVVVSPLKDPSSLHPAKPALDSRSCPDLAYIPTTGMTEEQNGRNKPDRVSEDLQKSSRGSTIWTSIRAVVKLRSAATAKGKGKVKKPTNRADSFIEKFTTTRQYGNCVVDADAEMNQVDGVEKGKSYDSSDNERDFVISPDGDFLFYWLCVMLVAVLYNLWFLIAREAWSEIQHSLPALWFSLDYFCDFLFVLDIIVQLRTGYLEHGLLVKNSLQLAKKYLLSLYFAADILALLPTDFFYFLTGIHPLLRFPRFLKFYRAREFYFKVETTTPHPNSLRVLNLVHILLLLTHWFAAVYFIFGELTDAQDGIWTYQNIDDAEVNTTARKYLASVYWSTLTLTTIGDIPTPTSNWEFIIQIIGYMMGVFIFASIVGQVGTVIENRNAARLEFERHVDHAKKYMREHKVPKDIQQTIIRWYAHTWSSGHMKGRGDVNTLGLLPAKLRTELALHVNLDTLKRVTFFQECPPEFLHELVLKMRFIIITPGDLVIRKGQIAREMFIISDGLLEVTGVNGDVLATLETGDFFGEIGILNLSGTSNKRTADVRSVGYSELFTLTKEDILGLLIDYPQAEKVLHDEGKKRLDRMKNNEHQASELTSGAASGSNNIKRSLRKARRLKGPSSSSSSSSRPHSPTNHLADMVQMAVQSAESTKSVLRSNKVAPLPTIEVQESRVNDETLSNADNRNVIARDVMESIEDIVVEKLEEVGKINKQLHMINEHLESQIRSLQESNERKTDEVMKLRKIVKDLKVVYQPTEESNL